LPLWVPPSPARPRPACSSRPASAAFALADVRLVLSLLRADGVRGDEESVFALPFRVPHPERPCTSGAKGGDFPSHTPRTLVSFSAFRLRLCFCVGPD
jgi:hypothetical protein